MRWEPIFYAMDKALLRRELRERRRQLPTAFANAASASAAAHLASSTLLEAGGNSQRIATYLASDGEFDPQPINDLLRDRGHELYLPRIDGNAMEFALWEADAVLTPNRYGIAEPAPATPVCAAPDLMLVLVPLVGWTDTGARLGMGGGYYDRYLGRTESSQRPWLVGLAYSCQQLATLVEDPWDVRLDAVLTEEGLRDFRG